MLANSAIFSLENMEEESANKFSENENISKEQNLQESFSRGTKIESNHSIDILLQKPSGTKTTSGHANIEQRNSADLPQDLR